jgi:hypothetical protein
MATLPTPHPSPSDESQMIFCWRRNLIDHYSNNRIIFLLLYRRLSGLSVRSLAKPILALGHCREAISVGFFKRPGDIEGSTEKYGIRTIISCDLNAFTKDQLLSQSIRESSSAFAISQPPGDADQAPALAQMSYF